MATNEGLDFRAIALTPEKRKEMIEDLIKLVSIPLIETFYVLGLETHINGTIEETSTGDTFFISFRKTNKKN